MKKKLTVLLGIMFLVILLGIGTTVLFFPKQKQTDDTVTIVTSFYPVYIAAENVTNGVKGVELINLAENQTGCLHDYQMTTKDMKKLENADIFIMNGGGMEGFVEEILKAYPQIQVINASEGIQLLEAGHEKEDEHEEGEHTHEEHDHGEYNAHVWLSPEDYIKQIENIRKGLSQYNSANHKFYDANATVYEEKVKGLQQELKETLRNPVNTKAVIFHDAFAYLLRDLGIEVVHEVDLDNDTSLSAGEFAEIVDEVKENKVTLLFTEAQFKTSAADGIGQETGARVYVMDSLVSGDMDKDAYINGMEKNMETLKTALYE